MIRRIFGEKKHKALQRAIETIKGGSILRYRLLVALLKGYYVSKFRKEWVYADEPPHFYDHKMGLFKFTFGNNVTGIGPYFRGFLNSEVILQGSKLLDIGCGDGFFTKRFFSRNCSHIDAIDIEPTAIGTAQRENHSDKINFLLLDAVNDKFPSDNYDVIVWDGAIGHFAKDTTDIMLGKIKNALKEDGVFVGSESIGTVEGVSDHLQFFYSLDDFHKILSPYFKYIELKKLEYPIFVSKEHDASKVILRTEGYWRCSNSKEKLQNIDWKKYYN